VANPSLDGTNPTIHLEFKAVPAEPDASGEVNSYYDQKHKLSCACLCLPVISHQQHSYCIALVTAHGEGFASRWSPWVEFPRKVEKTHVKVTGLRAWLCRLIVFCRSGPTSRWPTDCLAKILRTSSRWEVPGLACRLPCAVSAGL
jgi:hypothetical protein